MFICSKCNSKAYNKKGKREGAKKIFLMAGPLIKAFSPPPPSLMAVGTC